MKYQKVKKKAVRRRIKEWLYKEPLRSDIGGHKIIIYDKAIKSNGGIFRVMVGRRLEGYNHTEDYKFIVYTHDTDKGSYGALTRYRRVNSFKKAVRIANKLILSINEGEKQ